MPKILFVHENYPAQFGNLALYLTRRGWDVLFATAAAPVPKDHKMHVIPPGLRVVGYKRSRDVRTSAHPYLRATEHAVLNAQGFSRTAAGLMKAGYRPDVVVAHSGWGSGSLSKVVWPDTKFVQYLEWWYDFPAIDAPEQANIKDPENRRASTLCRNLPFLLDAQIADAILVPTAFQARQIHPLMQPLVRVQHDGVDTKFFSPAPDDEPTFHIDGLPDDAQIVTYATRGMEPLRGFPQFMRAAARLQSLFPKLHIVIAGSDSVHYSARLPKGTTYGQIALERDSFDMSRLHFTGRLPIGRYRDLLRRSAVHVYLTRPFVLSWSMIEAMAAGCALVLSDNDATREAARAGDEAEFVDMDDVPAITQKIADLLNDPKRRGSLSAAARLRAQTDYSSQVCHPAIENLLFDVISEPSPIGLGQQTGFG